MWLVYIIKINVDKVSVAVYINLRVALPCQDFVKILWVRLMFSLIF